MPTKNTRREFCQQLVAAGCGAALTGKACLAAPDVAPSLAGEVGVTTSSLDAHLAPRAERGIQLLELPKLLRQELDLRVIDLNTSSIASLPPPQLEPFRQAAEDAGCVLTNLKLNQRGLDMNSPDEPVRRRALDQYQRSLDTAARLGLRWARPLPLRERPDMPIHVASYRQLADYGAKRGIQLLVENYGWMQSDPQSVANVVKAVGHNVAACPDTGNWDSEPLRAAALASSFPLAVTCDFKARQLGPQGQHAAYDLKRCFEIGWAAGFRGPWCLEHAHADRAQLFQELAQLRDMLRRWMREGE